MTIIYVHQIWSSDMTIIYDHQIWSYQQDYHHADLLQHDQQPCVYFSSEQLWHCQQSGKRQMCIVQTNFTSSSSSVNGIVIIIIIIIIVNTWRDPPKTGSKINGSCAEAELNVKTYTPRLPADTDIFQIKSSSVSYRPISLFIIREVLILTLSIFTAL